MLELVERVHLMHDARELAHLVGIAMVGTAMVGTAMVGTAMVGTAMVGMAMARCG